MPAIFAPIGVFLAYIAGKLAFRVLGALGMGVAVYTSIDSGIEALEGSIASSFSGVASDILGVASMAGLTEFVSIVFSAYSSTLLTKLVAGSFKKLAFIPQPEG